MVFVSESVQFYAGFFELRLPGCFSHTDPPFHICHPTDKLAFLGGDYFRSDLQGRKQGVGPGLFAEFEGLPQVTVGTAFPVLGVVEGNGAIKEGAQVPAEVLPAVLGAYPVAQPVLQLENDGIVRQGGGPLIGGRVGPGAHGEEVDEGHHVLVGVDCTVPGIRNGSASFEVFDPLVYLLEYFFVAFPFQKDLGNFSLM